MSYFYHMIVYGIVFSLILVVGIFVLGIIRVVERVCMIKMVDVNKLTEGDWVAEDVKVNGKVICSTKSLGLEKEQIEAKYKGQDLSKGYDYIVDEKAHTAHLTEDGEGKVCTALNVNIGDIVELVEEDT